MDSSAHQKEVADGSSNYSHRSFYSSSTISASSSSLLTDLENGESLIDLEKEEKKLSDVNDRQEKRVESLQSKVYELIGFYLVFQGVVLTAIAQGSFLRCHNWWLPFMLSLIAAVAIILAAVQMLSKLGRCKDELDHNRRHAEKIRNKILLKKIPAKSKRKTPDPATEGIEQHSPDLESKIRRSIYPVVVILTLLAFTAFILIACRKILCEPGPMPEDPSRGSGSP